VPTPELSVRVEVQAGKSAFAHCESGNLNKYRALPQVLREYTRHWDWARPGSAERPLPLGVEESPSCIERGASRKRGKGRSWALTVQIGVLFGGREQQRQGHTRVWGEKGNPPCSNLRIDRSVLTHFRCLGARGGSPSRSEVESSYRGDEVAGRSPQGVRDRWSREQNSAYERVQVPTNPYTIMNREARIMNWAQTLTP
jgi:hypothetical protein